MNYVQFKHVILLTGAGISVESGIPIHKDSDEVWTRKEMENFFRPDTFRKNPDTVHDFYNQRRQDLKEIQPNKTHFHIAYLQEQLLGSRTKLTIITKNVDDLHEKAGATDVIHILGELNAAMCTICNIRTKCLGDLNTEASCTHCKSKKSMRPDIVWTGETPHHMDKVQTAFTECDLFVSIGTSGMDHPATDFVDLANKTGAVTVELDQKPSANATSFDHTNYGPTSTIVPFWIDTFIHGQPDSALHPLQ